MPTPIRRICIISSNGRLRDSLRVLLKSCYPQVPIDEAETIPAARQIISGDPFTLALLDASLPENQAWSALKELGTLCLLLTHSFVQQKQAEAAGVQAVMIDQLSTKSLLAAAPIEEKQS